MEWVYDSALEMTQCVDRLRNLRKQSVDEWNPVSAEISTLSDTQLRFVYKGRKFSKHRRTEYVMTFAPGDTSSCSTKITVRFRRELFHLPLPMTSVQELDAFMAEALAAYRGGNLGV